MAKKSFGRKKGIQQSIPRHRIGAKEVGGQKTEYNEAVDTKFLGLRRSTYFRCSCKCLEIITFGCEKFHLLGFKRTEDGDYAPLNGRAQIWHYISIACFLAASMQKVGGTVAFLVYEELQIKSFMCLSLAIVYIIADLISVGVILRPKESMDVLNSWSYVAPHLENIDSSSTFHPLEDMCACLKVIGLFFICQGVVVAATLAGVVMSDLPICLFPITERLGLLPDDLLPRLAWQVIFAPIEWLTYLPPMLITSFCAAIMFMGNGALNIYFQQLRKVTVRSIQSRRRVEREYVQLELFSRIFQVWGRFFMPPTLLAASCGVILALFVTIRYTELPLTFYMFFPYTGFALMLIIFWQCYDMVCASRASEDILGVLWRHEAPYFKGMTRTRRVELMKRARAMRPLVFPLADSEFSLSLPINTWEEILNQIVFLLSL